MICECPVVGSHRRRSSVDASKTRAKSQSSLEGAVMIVFPDCNGCFSSARFAAIHPSVMSAGRADGHSRIVNDSTGLLVRGARRSGEFTSSRSRHAYPNTGDRSAFLRIAAVVMIPLRGRLVYRAGPIAGNSRGVLLVAWDRSTSATTPPRHDAGLSRVWSKVRL